MMNAGDIVITKDNFPIGIALTSCMPGETFTMAIRDSFMTTISMKSNTILQDLKIIYINIKNHKNCLINLKKVYENIKSKHL